MFRYVLCKFKIITLSVKVQENKAVVYLHESIMLVFQFYIKLSFPLTDCELNICTLCLSVASAYC